MKIFIRNLLQYLTSFIYIYHMYIRMLSEMLIVEAVLNENLKSF